MENSGNIRFTFIGDLFLGGEFLAFARKQGIGLDVPFREVLPILEDSDVLLLNLEGPLHAGSQRREGVTAFLANDPQLLDIFRNCGCVFNLANNHIMDYGAEGLEKTISLLRKNGIPFVGAGLNQDDAGRECVIERRGRRIAFLAFASPEPHVGAVSAGPTSAGCIPPDDVERISGKIRAFKREGLVVCVSVHWGREFFSYPDYRQVEVSRKFADAGADYVIGHHPHVRQGFERRGGALILYSLGNFFLPPIRSLNGRYQPRKKSTREFLIARSDLNAGLEFLGGRVNGDYRLVPFKEKANLKLRENIDDISRPLSGVDYASFWDDYRIRREKELERESLREAFSKLIRTPPSDLFRGFTGGDLRRNLKRLLRSI